MYEKYLREDGSIPPINELFLLVGDRQKAVKIRHKLMEQEKIANFAKWEQERHALKLKEALKLKKMISEMTVEQISKALQGDQADFKLGEDPDDLIELCSTIAEIRYYQE